MNPAIPNNIQLILDIVTTNQKLILAIAKQIDELSSQVSELEVLVTEIEQQVSDILDILLVSFAPTTGSMLIQTNGDSMGTINGIVVGTTGTFLRSNLPAGSGGLAKGTVPTYVSSDPAVTIGPDASDPTNTDKISAAVAATDTAPSFDIAVTITPALDATGAPGTPVTNSFTVPIHQVPPPFVPTTASDLNQTS